MFPQHFKLLAGIKRISLSTNLCQIWVQILDFLLNCNHVAVLCRWDFSHNYAFTLYHMKRKWVAIPDVYNENGCDVSLMLISNKAHVRWTINMLLQTGPELIHHFPHWMQTNVKYCSYWYVKVLFCFSKKDYPL